MYARAMAESQDADPVVRQMRAEISDIDRALVEHINKRLRLVERLKEYKESRGYSFVDPAREAWMVQDLQRANRGPLTADGLKEIYEEILAMTKREVSERR
jgi:chorismate mutase/prephenate dehydratase